AAGQLVSRLLTQSPGAVQPVLEAAIAGDAAPEAARVAALEALRRAPLTAANGLGQALERALATSSQKLRAAALPIYARVGSPARALELAGSSQAGPPALRAASAAAYAALAVRSPAGTGPPDNSSNDADSANVRAQAQAALKALATDGVAEVRAEATR